MKKKNIFLSLIVMVVAFSFLNSNSTDTNKTEYAAAVCWYEASQSESGSGAQTGYNTAGTIAAGVSFAAGCKTVGAIAASTGNPVGWGVAAVAFGV
ncbi:MAG: hypothetical protein IK003_01480 [Prevotella sp.]|jgi:hypothetical protein|nr:hypothetical protein [Prevotella sp.]